MALLKFFREAIVDKESMEETCLQLESTSCRMKIEERRIDVTRPGFGLPKSCLIEDKSLQCVFEKDIMSASMPFIHFMVFLQVVKIARGRFGAGLRVLQQMSVVDLKQEVKKFVMQGRDRLRSFLDEVGKRVKKCLKMATIIVGAPACLVQQAFRSMDKR